MKTFPSARIIVAYLLMGFASMNVLAETNDSPAAVLLIPKAESGCQLDSSRQLSIGGTNTPGVAIAGDATTRYSMQILKPDRNKNYCLQVIRPAAGTNYAIRILR